MCWPLPSSAAGKPVLPRPPRPWACPSRWIDHAALKGEQGRCLTRSVRAEAEVGLASVAEAAALAAAGPDSRLILPRIARDGVTLALAEGPGAA